MKLIIQIPCFNEAETLAITLASLPRRVNGFATVEWLIIDDGCTDDTVRVAKENGVDHIIHHINNKGLARAFMSGLDACTSLGADVIVNTDADNQYDAKDISILTNLIVNGQADMVVGARPINDHEEFSSRKKILQKIGSQVVRFLSRTNVPDAPSGFRAFSRKAAMQLNVFSEYTYTLETIIQAGHKNMAVASVPIRVNKELRPSRLFKSIPSYIQRSVVTMVRIFVVYRPFRFFSAIGVFFCVLAFLIGCRFVYYLIQGFGEGHIQSLILVAILAGAGFQAIMVAFVADLLAVNRKLLEDIKYSLKQDSQQ